MSEVPVSELVVALVCVLLGSFGAGAEAAITALPPARLRALRDEIGPHRGAALERFLADPTGVLTRLLALRTTALIVAAVLATNALVRGRAPFWHLALLVSALALIYGACAEVLTTIARARARSVAPLALALARPLEILGVPLAAPLLVLGRAIDKRAAQRNSSDPPPLTEREVEYVVEEAGEAGALDERRGELLQNVLELKDVRARDVMVPRTQIAALELRATAAQAHALVNAEGHSRVPVYSGQIDNVVGVLHVKDLIRANHGAGARAEEPIEPLVRRPVLYVAETTFALSLLRDMQARRTHMAMVADEYGGLVGLVTLEDILEELVGEIQDEHDAEEALLVEEGGGKYLAAAVIPLAELGEQLGVEFPERDGYDSLGGFLAERAGRVPPVGTVVEWSGLRFTVREGDARRATKVEIVRHAAGHGGDAAQTAAE